MLPSVSHNYIRPRETIVWERKFIISIYIDCCQIISSTAGVNGGRTIGGISVEISKIPLTASSHFVLRSQNTSSIGQHLTTVWEKKMQLLSWFLKNLPCNKIIFWGKALEKVGSPQTLLGRIALCGSKLERPTRYIPEMI